MKKFIALVALVLVSASTMMYAQESNREVRRADRKAQRDAERARLKAEEQAADQVAYQQAVQAIKDKQFVRLVRLGSRPSDFQTWPDRFRVVKH